MARGSVIKRTRKDGKPASYAIKYRDITGKQRWETVGTSKKEAERLLADRLSQINGGTYAKLEDATFEQFSILWLDKYARPRLKESTLDSYARHIRLHWIPAFGGLPLQRLTTSVMEAAVSDLLASGLSPKSVNNALVVLKLMLKHAVRWNYLAVNPATDVDRVRVEPKEMQAMSPEQVKRLLAAADEESWLLLTVAVFTGLRRGELLALQWGDIDFDARQVHVRRSLWRNKFIGPKTKNAVRRVDLAPQVVRALREAQPSAATDGIERQLVFSNANGQPLDPDNMVKRRFHPALKRAELPHFRFHDLRHTFASLLIAAGEHPKAIQQALGHASITTTLDTYGHLLPGAFKHSGERIQKAVLGDGDLPRP